MDAVTADDDAGSTRVLSGVLGLLGVIAGLVVMRRPGESLLAIILIIGVWFVVSGLVDAIRAIACPATAPSACSSRSSTSSSAA